MTDASTPAPDAQPPLRPAGSKTMQLLNALRGVTLPGAQQDIVALNLVKNISISEGLTKFNILVEGEPDSALEDFLEARIGECLSGLDWITEVEMGFVTAPAGPPTASLSGAAAATHAPPNGASPFAPGGAAGGGLPPAAAAAVPLAAGSAAAPQGGMVASPSGHGPALPENPLPNVRHVIAVGSGKGGVGKSTVSVNLALALCALGYKTGLLDGDVYGPSVPLMLGLRGQPYVNDEEKLVPPEVYGLKVMSMGLLLKPEQAVVWRGPMVHGVMRQFIGDVDWGPLDFLIVDLPPGTGDAPLSLSQALPLTSSLVVTTPQEVAASVAEKAMAMFERLKIRLAGVVENMSGFVCPHCGETTDVFGTGGGERLARLHEVPFLGALPIDLRMRQGGDIGRPVMLQFPDSDLARQFKDIAAKLAQYVEQPVVASAETE